MAKVNKKLEELTKTMDEVFLDKEEYWKEISYEEGENKAKKEIAKKMLEENMDILFISKITQLSKEEIENL